MSWGERSCKVFGDGCKISTYKSCNVNCIGYKFDGIHKPDSQTDNGKQFMDDYEKFKKGR